MKKAAIIGGAGYAARELTACLVRHPHVILTQVISSSQNGLPVAEFHKDWAIPAGLRFSGQLDQPMDVLFLCGGHGVSRAFLENNAIGEDVVIIDLSMDFRTDPGFVYGLPEMHRGMVSNRIANPGCFATAIQLGMLPTLGTAANEWHIHALTGSSGAGQQLQSSSHFSWRENNVSTYKVFDHQHLVEMEYNGLLLVGLQGNKPFPKLRFTPLRGPFTRGIFATLYTETSWSEEEAWQLYADYYAGAAFTKVIREEPDLKQVVGTNYCVIQPRVVDGQLFVTAIIDNLLKGAAGQAVQNMNLRYGWPEAAGLELKPIFI